MVAGCAGVTVAADGPLTEYPSTMNVIAAEVPPGAGFVTVTLTLPAVARSAAGIVAERLVALMNFVASAFPLKFTTDPDTKFVPESVSVKAVPPGMCTGPNAVTSGTKLPAAFTAKFRAGEDGPVVGLGFVTVTVAVPADAISVARIAAVNLLLLTKVVVRLAPLNCTVAPFTNPLPLTVRVNAAPPSFALDGDRDERVGGALLIVNEAAFDVPPPGAGFVTVTFVTSALAMSAAEIAALN